MGVEQFQVTKVDKHRFPQECEIYRVDSDGVEIGSVAFFPQGSQIIASLFHLELPFDEFVEINPELRGQGYGSQVWATAELAFQKNHPGGVTRVTTNVEGTKIWLEGAFVQVQAVLHENGYKVEVTTDTVDSGGDRVIIWQAVKE